MKRKITCVIIFLLLSSVSSGILAGCGKNTEIVKDPVEENSMIEVLPKGNIAEEGSDKYILEEEAEAADNSLSGGPELDWITLEEVLRLYGKRRSMGDNGRRSKGGKQRASFEIRGDL